MKVDTIYSGAYDEGENNLIPGAHIYGQGGKKLGEAIGGGAG